MLRRADPRATFKHVPFFNVACFKGSGRFLRAVRLMFAVRPYCGHCRSSVYCNGRCCNSLGRTPWTQPPCHCKSRSAFPNEPPHPANSSGVSSCSRMQSRVLPLASGGKTWMGVLDAPGKGLLGVLAEVVQPLRHAGGLFQIPHRSNKRRKRAAVRVIHGGGAVFAQAFPGDYSFMQ